MGRDTKIKWTDKTFNPVWGCTKVSPGCANCYAESIANRWQKAEWGPGAKRRTFGDKHWLEPFAWDRKAAKAGERVRVFSGSMCDLFEDEPVVRGELQKLWSVIRNTPNLDWQLLTKRADQIRDNLPDDWGDGWPNVWLGVSIESMKYAGRATILRRIPAVVRFISYEPALGELCRMSLRDIDWVIYGGESGPKYRPHDIDWLTNMVRRCEMNDVAFYYKQSSHVTPGYEDAPYVRYRAFPTPRPGTPPIYRRLSKYAPEGP